MIYRNLSAGIAATILGLALIAGCQPKSTPATASATPPEAAAQETPSGAAAQQASPTAGENAETTTTPAAAAETPEATPALAETPLEAPKPAAVKEGEQTLTPLPGAQAPKISEVVRIQVSTTSGNFVVAIYPQAAPNAAERFITLVQKGFYDNTPISRVVTDPKPFVAQFGINSRMPEWQNNNFNDDPSLFSLEKGTLAFAKAGPNTNSTQVFINLTNNDFLTNPSMNFSAFGKVESGIESVDKFIPTGDPGLDQGRLWSDPDYLDSVASKPTMIISMKVI